MYTGHMTTTPTESRPVMARCTRKGCQFVRRADVTGMVGETSDRYGNVRRTWTMSLAGLPECPDHGPVEVHEVRGTVTETECDARCTSAKGHVCECACGGANHGTDH